MTLTIESTLLSCILFKKWILLFYYHYWFVFSCIILVKNLIESLLEVFSAHLWEAHLQMFVQQPYDLNNVISLTNWISWKFIWFFPKCNKIKYGNELEQVEVYLSKFHIFWNRWNRFIAVFVISLIHNSNQLFLVIFIFLKNVLPEVFGWELWLHGDIKIFNCKSAQILLEIFFLHLVCEILVNEVDWVVIRDKGC